MRQVSRRLGRGPEAGGFVMSGRSTKPGPGRESRTGRGKAFHEEMISQAEELPVGGCSYSMLKMASAHAFG